MFPFLIDIPNISYKMVDEINALELLKEELTEEEIHLKVNAIHRMKTVILSIGALETIKSLLPYLESKYDSFKLIKVCRPC